MKIIEVPSLCNLDREIGPCRAYWPRWWYNKQTKTCEPFGFGGCKGNANNFLDQESCERECDIEKKKANKANEEKLENDENNSQLTHSDDDLKPKPKSSICYQDKETGYCKAYFPKFFFNKETKKCEKFIWGGCGGKLILMKSYL